MRIDFLMQAVGIVNILYTKHQLDDLFLEWGWGKFHQQKVREYLKCDKRAG